MSKHCLFCGFVVIACVFPMAAQSQNSNQSVAITSTNATFSATSITVERDPSGKIINCWIEDLAFLKGSYRSMTYVTNDLAPDLVPNGFDKNELEKLMRASNLIRTIHIFQAQANKHYELMPDGNICTDETKHYAQSGRGKLQPAFKTEKMGVEMVNGHSCVKQKFTTSLSDERLTEGTMWEAPDLGGLIIRSETMEPSKKLTITEMRRISLVPPAESLFSVPSGYRIESSTRAPIDEDRDNVMFMMFFAGAFETLPPSMESIRLYLFRSVLGTNFAFTAVVVHTARFDNGASVDDTWQKFAFLHDKFRFNRNMADGSMQHAMIRVGGEEMNKKDPYSRAVVKTFRQDSRLQTTEIFLPDEQKHNTIFPWLSACLQEAWKPSRVSEKRIEKTELGRETIDGHPCVKKKYVLGRLGIPQGGLTVWEASDLAGLPIRIESLIGGGVFITQFKDIKLQPPDESLFTTSADYKCCQNKEDLGWLMTEKVEGLRGNKPPVQQVK